MEVSHHLRPRDFPLAYNYGVRVQGGFFGDCGGMESSEDYRYSTRAVGIRHLVCLKSAGAVGGQRHEIKVQARLVNKRGYLINLDVFQLHIIRGRAGQREQGQTWQLSDDLASVHKLRQGDPQLDELSGLYFYARDRDETDFHALPPFFSKTREKKMAEKPKRMQ